MSKLISLIENKEYKSAEQYIKKQKYIRWNDHLNQDGKSALHLVAMTGPLSLLQLMIARGCPWDMMDNHGFTPIHYARKANQVDIFLELNEMYKIVGIELPSEFISDIQSLYYPKRKFSVLDRLGRKSIPQDISITNEPVPVIYAGSSSSRDAYLESPISDGTVDQKIPILHTPRNLIAQLEDCYNVPDALPHYELESELDCYNRYQMLFKKMHSEYIKAKNNLELSLFEAGLTIVDRLEKPNENNKHAIKKIRRKLKNIDEMFIPVDSEEKKHPSEHKHQKSKRKARVKKDKPASMLKNNIRQLFVSSSVSDSVLTRLRPEDIRYLAISFFHNYEPIAILKEIISAWYWMPNKMKPASIYFVMQLINADNSILHIGTKPFKEVFDLFLSQLESDIPAISRCGLDLRIFSRFLLSRAMPMCDDIVLQQAMIDTKNLSEIFPTDVSHYVDIVENIAEDLLGYHIWNSFQLGRNLLTSRGWDLFVNSFNKLSHMVAFQLLTSNSDRHREQIARLYLDVADKLVKKNEFHFSHAIFSAFSKSSIFRLKQFDAFLSQDAVYIRLNELFEISKNFKNYRERIKETGGLPYWGLLSNDFIHLAELEVNFNYYLFEGKTYSIVHDTQNKFIGTPLHFYTNIVTSILQTNIDEELLNSLSCEILPRTLYLNDNLLVEELIKNLQCRERHKLGLAIYDSELKLASGLAAFDSIYAYVCQQLADKIFSYESCKNIMSLAVNLIQDDALKINMLPYLLGLMDINSVPPSPVTLDIGASSESSAKLLSREISQVKRRKKEELASLSHDRFSLTLDAVLTPRIIFSRTNTVYQDNDKSDDVVNSGNLHSAQAIASDISNEIRLRNLRREKM
ncbi:RasGEF domain-containing protein [Candidatus Berkiella cookevillensis]|uniref:RasGEF domain protein n=2 Tax=Candidatus Berkiella cookevillensis TaxID=437022 RepID=A0A0Q9YSV0_9GAMM